MKLIEAIDPASMAAVLSEVADIASETIALNDVCERIGVSVRKLIPFKNLVVVRILGGDRVALHASADPVACPGGEVLEAPMAHWSPRWRPRPDGYTIDEKSQLDPGFPMEAMWIADGMESGLWEPFRRGSCLMGGVWLCSLEPHAFSESHKALMRPIAALLGASVEHWQIWECERRRRERLDRVEAVLGTLADSLDVREIFERLSAELQTILPHDLINLTEIDLRARTIRVVASAGVIPVRTERFALLDEEVERRADYAIVDDVLVEVPPSTERNRLIRGSGMRSWLHVPVWLSGEITGSLSFLHREPSRYTQADGEIALGVSARVAVSLSHHQLAEEAQAAARARERADRLEARVEELAKEIESRDGSWVVGVSSSWKQTLGQVHRVAGADTTVLITGESGTGKEVVAKLIHEGSGRAHKVFVAINCAALPEQLLESELFGHEKGAFTGAIATKIGRIEQADGGTLFLDEVAEMSPQVQAKLLRVLEQREFQRVGGNRTLKADVRVIAATNQDLPERIVQSAFREDLYYRLNVFHIPIAALRERPEDIAPLAEAFLKDLGRTMGRPAAGISRDAREWMLAYPWPGNVRELRNAIERGILLCDGGLITQDHLPAWTAPRPAGAVGVRTAPSAAGPHDSSVDLGTAERALIEKALRQSKGNKSKAARLLGLTRSQLYTRLEKHGIQ